MNVTVLKETKTFDNMDSVFEQIQVFLNKCLADQEIYFSHMVIDGVEVYHDFEFYIEDNLNEIKDIQIKVKTPLEFTKDITQSIQGYAGRALPELNLLSDDFYQSSTSNSWEKLNDLLEALQWVHGAIDAVDKNKVKPSNWDKYLTIASSFELVFPNLLEALEAQDNILVADIISYELVPLFKDLEQMGLMGDLANKGNNNDVEGKH